MVRSLLTLTVFGGGVLAGVLLTGGLLVSVAPGTHRLWPPGDDGRKLRLYLLCSWTFLVSFIITPVLDAGTGPLSGAASTVAGAAVLLSGVAVLLSATYDLGEQNQQGKAAGLETEGLYRYSRNPQAVGWVLFVSGTAIASNSVLTAVLGALGVVWFALTVPAEEAWLREQYGDEYVDYCRRVPRFVGLRSIRRVFERFGSGS